ncbi:hypothetical protein HNQ00_003013 [Flavobacterium sp. 14A]|nr:hypothetical protein [Flavobacterium sp. 14A]
MYHHYDAFNFLKTERYFYNMTAFTDVAQTMS